MHNPSYPLSGVSGRPDGDLVDQTVPCPSARSDPGTGLVDQKGIWSTRQCQDQILALAQHGSGRPELGLVDQNCAESTVLGCFLFVPLVGCLQI